MVFSNQAAGLDHAVFAGRTRTRMGSVHACNLRKARKKWPCLHQYAVANQPDGQPFDGKRVARVHHDGGVIGIFGVQFYVRS